MTANPKKAIILLSGGLDSTTVLALAQSQAYECYTLSFDYGQRHRAELQTAATIAAAAGVVEHRIIPIDLASLGGSALTDAAIAVPDADPDSHAHARNQQIPITYVPARNTVFLSLALAWAEVIAAQHIFIGVNAVDYSGYPDCRPDYIAAYEHMANLGTRLGAEGKPLRIHTPLANKSKAEIIRQGMELGVDYAQTVSCYQANAEGEACGNCDSCYLRRQGFEQANLSDPTRYNKAPKKS